MNIQGPHGSGTKDKIFAQVENGGTTTIAAGSLCVWDTTVNDAVAGILENTLGYRIIICPAAPTTFEMAGIADTAMDGTPAALRGPVYLLQIYGHRKDLLIDTAAADNDTVVGGLLIPSTDTAGKMQGCSTNATPTATELGKAVGVAFKIVAVAATDTIDGFIRLM